MRNGGTCTPVEANPADVTASSSLYSLAEFLALEPSPPIREVSHDSQLVGGETADNDTLSASTSSDGGVDIAGFFDLPEDRSELNFENGAENIEPYIEVNDWTVLLPDMAEMFGEPGDSQSASPKMGPGWETEPVWLREVSWDDIFPKKPSKAWFPWHERASEEDDGYMVLEASDAWM
ncbi:hypothetical protein M8818_007525 [Zalaria obscura]|uniref:Uncharacterized protein n=1 Tax=Zalaria obscura TaxID=2024903 RepID=A0ACC3S3F9_9PEZI